MPTEAVAILVSMAVAAVGTGLLLPLLRRHVADVPNERSSHSVAVPRGGGVGVVLGILVTAVCLDLSAVTEIRSLTWVALALLLVTGLVDDLRTLGTLPRLAVQVMSGALVVASLGPLTGRGIAMAVVGVIFVVGLVNAFNFMDGINGISAITVVVAAGWFIWLGHETPAQSGVAALMVGSALGFLVWNAAGKIFLGDVGSYFLGGLLAVQIVSGIDAGVSAWLMIAPIVLYVGDTVGTLLLRAARGQRIGAAHRDHVYQRLNQAGLSHLQVAALVGAVEALLCVATWLLRDSLILVVMSWVALLAVYALTPVMIRQRVEETA